MNKTRVFTHALTYISVFRVISDYYRLAPPAGTGGAKTTSPYLPLALLGYAQFAPSPTKTVGVAILVL